MPTFFHSKSVGKNFNAQGHVTLKQIVCSCLKWNLSKILSLSSLSARLKKIRSKLLMCPQYFFQCSKASNLAVSGRLCLEFELVWTFLFVSIKMRALLYSQHFLNYKSICHSRASNSETNGQNWLEMEFIWDFGCLYYLQVWQRSNQKWRRFSQNHIFSITSV